nr:unnamed protein product [Digitaria exilis]
MPTPLPIGWMNAGRPLLADAAVGLIPSPKKSTVAGLPPNSDDWPIMSSGRHTGAPVESYGRPSPSPADSIGAAPGDDEEMSRPRPRRNEELDEVAPICAAFCSSAATGAEKMEDDASVARHSDGGFAGMARSERPTPPPARSGNCGAGAIDDGANMPPMRLCDVPATLLLLLALTLAAVAEVCESTGTGAARDGCGGAN